MVTAVSRPTDAYKKLIFCQCDPALIDLTLNTATIAERPKTTVSPTLHNNNNDLLTDPLGGSSLLNYLQIKLHYINYNYKINQIKLFTNYAAPTGLTVSSKIN